MKSPRSFLSLLAFGVAVSAFPVSPVVAAEEEAAETELGKHMEDIGASWRRVRRQVAEPASNAATAELVAKIRANAELSLKLAPVRAEDLPEAERPAFIASYKKEMQNFVQMLLNLEKALNEGRNEDAVKLVADIGAHQRSAHKEFRRPE